MDGERRRYRRVQCCLLLVPRNVESSARLLPIGRKHQITWALSPPLPSSWTTRSSLDGSSQPVSSPHSLAILCFPPSRGRDTSPHPLSTVVWVYVRMWEIRREGESVLVLRTYLRGGKALCYFLLSVVSLGSTTAHGELKFLSSLYTARYEC